MDNNSGALILLIVLIASAFLLIVLKLAQFVNHFSREKHAAKKKRSDGLMHIFAPAMLAICICAICLCGASWAWFTASTSTGTTAIQSSSYKLLYQVNEDTAPTELAEADNTYTLTSDTTVITLKATGTAGATGYCSIKIGDETYSPSRYL